MKTTLFIVLVFTSCQIQKSDEAKIIEMNRQFDKSMRHDTYFYHDTLKNLKAKEVSIAIEYIYDSINGVKRIEKSSSGGGYNFYEQVNFLNGEVYKTKIQMIPDSIKPRTKFKAMTSMYYVVDGKVIQKIADFMNLKAISYQIHLDDSIAKSFEQKLNLR